MEEFTHIDEQGQVRMVDVTDKKPSERVAVAQGVVSMNPATFEKIQNQNVKKGNVLETARIAGVMAAKKTSDLIPMCHPINITHIAVDFYPQQDACAFKIEATVRIFGQTGVEMEALTAVSVAALTIYDMCKSYDKAMTISDICLVKKSGGKSGTFVRNNVQSKHEFGASS
ncbi:MAG: cyclic pyranopterin monophosphate synthase MoaC [Desulfobacterales bacterium]|uniref:Cyclic pyranopterin monophosphate synthase n=1 Tax=Candidatus Desulfatibia vada TaxID=2841696 RepID=A0A8J6P598_9BACT|nr:cyclic pyranopterin monophosphate synthase MoaC [Candidatus Desulfatibia vada]